ncbi:MAG: hypothetical protein AAB853_01805, partial [Patescibacteria group bacterium]
MSPDGAEQRQEKEKPADTPDHSAESPDNLEQRAASLQKKASDFRKNMREYEQKAQRYGKHGSPLRDELRNVRQEFLDMLGNGPEVEMDRRVQEFLSRMLHASVESEREVIAELNRDRSPEAGAMKRLFAPIGNPAITLQYLRSFRESDRDSSSGFRAESFVKTQNELLRSLGREMPPAERLRIAGLIVNGEWEQLSAMHMQLRVAVEEREIRQLQMKLREKENDVHVQRSIVARNANALGEFSAGQTGLLGKTTGLGKDITPQLDRQANMTLQATRNLHKEYQDERDLRKAIDLRNLEVLRMQNDALRQSDPNAADLALVRGAIRVPSRAFDDAKAKSLREKVEQAKARLRESGQWSTLNPEEQALATQNDLAALRMRALILQKAPHVLGLRGQLEKRSNFFVSGIAPAEEFLKDRAYKGKALDTGTHAHDFYAQLSLLDGTTYTVGVSRDLAAVLSDPDRAPLILVRKPKGDMKMTTRTHTKTRNVGRGETLDTEVVDEHRIADCDVITMADVAPRGDAQGQEERSFTLTPAKAAGVVPAGFRLRNIVTIEGEVIANVRVAEEAERTLGNVPAGYTAVLRRIPKDSLQPEDIAFVREEQGRALSVDTDGDGVADRTHTADEFREQKRAQENLLTMMPLLTPLQHLERGGQEIMARFGPLQTLLEGMAKSKPTEQAVHTAKEYARSLLSIYNRSRLLHESQP